MTAPSAYPLQWPPGWPRTEPTRREKWPGGERLSVPRALDDLTKELRLLGATGVVLSSNCSLGNESPADPGIVAYAVYDKQQIAIPCDRWTNVVGNLRAIARTIEAMRGMERWGAKHMIRAMFQGFTALPPNGSDWRTTLRNPTTLAEAEAMFRTLMKTAHPDAGGSHEAAARLNQAMDQARREFANG